MTDDLERRLREALHQEAERVTPRDRRTEILAMAHDEAQTVEPARRWLLPVTAAASVALIGAVIWGASNSGSSPQLTPAVSHPVTSTPSPTPAPAPPPATVAAPNPSPVVTAPGRVATTQAALPAYFVGASNAVGNRFGLYREFVSTAVPVGATTAQKARAAVAVAMSSQPFTASEHYLRPWAGTSVTNLTVTPSSITISLSGTGAGGFTPSETKLAVQQLVWTAQAAVGQGTIPVRFTVAGGASKLFGTYPTAQSYNRPQPSLQFEVLAPIWVISPARGQVVPAGATVVATGQSCAFEANTQWQLKKGGATVRSGSATATSGCPTRGDWKVRLGVLPSGSYTFRMYEVSMQDGSVAAERSRTFTVR